MKKSVHYICLHCNNAFHNSLGKKCALVNCTCKEKKDKNSKNKKLKKNLICSSCFKRPANEKSYKNPQVLNQICKKRNKKEMKKSHTYNAHCSNCFACARADKKNNKRFRKFINNGRKIPSYVNKSNLPYYGTMICKSKNCKGHKEEDGVNFKLCNKCYLKIISNNAKYEIEKVSEKPPKKISKLCKEDSNWRVEFNNNYLLRDFSNISSDEINTVSISNISTKQIETYTLNKLKETAATYGLKVSKIKKDALLDRLKQLVQQNGVLKEEQKLWLNSRKKIRITS